MTKYKVCGFVGIYCLNFSELEVGYIFHSKIGDLLDAKLAIDKLV